MNRSLFKELFDLLEEGVILVDARCKIINVNRFASKLLDIPKRHLLKKKFSSLSHPLIEKASALLERAKEQQLPVTESLCLEKYYELIASSQASSKGVILIRDRSDQKQVIEMGKMFVANASHELRTPITIIKGFAETLQDLPEISLEMLSEITEKIVRNCQRMENLVKSLLTLADLETIPSSRFQECDIIQLIESCRHLLNPIYPDTTIVIEAKESSITILADPDILELALFNLFENAAKYSSSPAHIFVNVENVGSEVKLIISDRGIGMKPQDLQHIFERFYTVDKARSRKLGGAGIGLSIVKTIVQKHEGTITVASELGKGTHFTLTFPALV